MNAGFDLIQPTTSPADSISDLPRQVRERFYAAEQAYMGAGGAGDFAATIGAMLAPDVAATRP